jgi:hypothetical protein
LKNTFCCRGEAFSAKLDFIVNLCHYENASPLLALILSTLYMFCLCQFAIAETMPYETDRPLYVGSRPLGMGNAYVAVADDAEAGFWNPAGLIQSQGVRIFASGKMLDREENVFDSKCVAFCYKGTALFWGNKIALRLENGDTPDYNYYSLAQKLSPHIAVGVSAKFKRRHPSDYYQFFGYKTDYDVGFLVKTDSDSLHGLLIQKLDNQDKWINAITLGSSYKMGGKVLSVTDMAILIDKKTLLEWHFGLEYSINHWLMFRVGVSDKKPTTGIGINVANIKFSYAIIKKLSFISAQIQL